MNSNKKNRELDRLTKRSDFLWVQSGGRKWVSKGMIVMTAPNDGLGTRFGITVTKRLSKKAVDRNRMKRRLRAAASDILSEFGTDNTDYVLLARPETATRPYMDLLNDLKWCLKKLESRKHEKNPESAD